MQNKYLETLKSHNDSFKYLVENLDSYLVSCFNKVNTMPSVLTTISFTGYTPYWNDGDPCQYRLNINPENLLFTLEDLDLYEMDLHDLEIDNRAKKINMDKLSLIGENFYKNLRNIPDIIFQSRKDHCLFKVNRTHVLLQNYNHD